jgi:CSLREA domain-containing protein
MRNGGVIMSGLPKRVATVLVGSIGLIAIACGPYPPPTTLPPNEVVVNDFADSDDGTCDETHCSLREAINQANTDAGVDTVVLPEGTFVVGSAPPPMAAAPAALQLAMAVGDDGEAFHVTDDLTITGAGAGVTTIDLSGDDFNIGWLVEASLTLSSLTVTNLGSGFAPLNRAVVATEMATAGEEVAFDQAIVEDIQPDAVLTPLADPSMAPFTKLVTWQAPGEGAAVTVRDSTIQNFGPSDMLIVTGNAPISIEGSLIDTTSVLGAGGAIAAAAGFNQSLSLSDTAVRRTTMTMHLPSESGLHTPQCQGLGALSYDGDLSVTDSTVEVDELDVGPCGGASVSAGGAAVVATGGTVTVDRSLIRRDGGPGQQAALTMSSSTDYGTGNCTNPVGSVRDSTISDSGAFGLMYLGTCDNPAPGIRLTIEGSTLTGYFGIATAGQNGVTQAPAPLISLQGSAVQGTTFDCSALNGGGVGLLVSAGHNTASHDRCDPTGAGDQSFTDPLLGPLQDNGGPSLTRAPLTGSPLIDSAGTCTGLDQRGIVRPQGVECDRGAVEVE